MWSLLILTVLDVYTGASSTSLPWVQGHRLGFNLYARALPSLVQQSVTSSLVTTISTQVSPRQQL